MNWIFFGLIGIAYLTTAYCQWLWYQHPTSDPAPMHVLTEQLLLAAGDAITLGIGLIGVLALFLGLMRIMEAAGLLSRLALILSPLLRWLFPEIPPHHPAMGAMAMNFSANMLGMGNAATPFGLKAMQELNTLNPHPGIATNAMVLFLAINTSSITLIPTKIIALRTSAGSADPAGIIVTTLLATLCSTIAAIVIAKWLQRFALPTETTKITTHPPEPIRALSKRFLYLLGLVGAFTVIVHWGSRSTPWILPTLILGILTHAMYKKVDLYDCFVEGAKGGFETAIRIIPYLVAILVAIGMFRASGALYYLTRFLDPILQPLGLPAEALPMVFMRPLSGSGSLGILAEILHNPAIGPDSYTGYLVSTMMGSTETTFYVLAVYFGAVQIKKIRHALLAGLCAEAVGIGASIIAVKHLFI